MMKKTLKSLAMLAFAALAVSSCQKENLRENEVTPGKQIEISVNGLMGEYQEADATKADLVNTVRVAWTGGEQVYAYTTSGLLGTLTASLEGTEDRYAKLSGTLSDPGDKTVTLVYSPQFSEAPSLNEAKISLDLSEQDGAKVPFVVYGTLDSKDLTVSNVIVPFKFATSVMKVNCTGLSEEEDITKAEISNVNTVCELTFKADDAPDIAGKTLGTITRKGTGAFCSADSRAIFQLAIVATEAAQPSERVLTISQDKDYVADFSACALASGKSYNSVYAMSPAPTFKAVYNTTGGANTLTFYYDAEDHSSEGTVYEGNSGDNYLCKDEINADAEKWGYNDNRGEIKSVVIDASVAGYKGLTSTAYMFQGMATATNISGAEYLDVSNVTDMSFMFQKYGHESQTFNAVPDVSKWNTGNVTNMANMFMEYGYKSTALNTVPDVSKWKTGKVTNMSGMFNGYGYTSENISCVLDLSGWDLSKITGTNGNDVFNFNPKTFNVTIPAKTGEKSNEGGKWYYGDGTNSIAPPADRTFTLPLAGALKGVFSVSATKKVHFSQGNLYADSEKALHFEANQYSSASSWEVSHVSHFTWSSTVEAAVGDSNSGDNLFCDESHKVSVDGGEAIYYALSKDEWTYLFEHHPNKWTTVNGVNGYVIAPDGFAGTLSDTYADDAALAANNLVFLPAAGSRNGSSVYEVGDSGLYWSSTAGVNDHVCFLYFDSSVVYPENFDSRNYGCSVRLVTDASVTPAPTPTTTGTAKATIGGSQVDVKWIQLWENGPKFAEYNVGAENSKAEDYGGYYAWGGSQDKVDDHNTGSSELSHTGDDITDTATKLWGSNWRMPTKTELQGLIDNCDVAWTTVNDKNGRKFTGKGAYASNSVFLPAAGYSNGTVSGQGNGGFYRSSTPNGSDYAFSLQFIKGSQSMYDKHSRGLGCSVRAVIAE